MRFASPLAAQTRQKVIMEPNSMEPNSMRRILSVSLVAALTATFLPAITFAGPIFSGKGTNNETGDKVSGSAEFSVSGDILTIVLKNTTAGGSLSQGDALTGVVFNITGGLVPLSLSSISLTSGSHIDTGVSTVNDAMPLAGSWTSHLSAGAGFEYGVATTGFNGLFQGGTITRGNSSPNYGLIADGTSLAHGFPRFPYIDNSLTFSFSGATGLMDSSFVDVNLLFGTNGTGVIDPPPPAVPEPGSITLAVMAIACVAAFARRRIGRKPGG